MNDKRPPQHPGLPRCQSACGRAAEPHGGVSSFCSLLSSRRLRGQDLVCVDYGLTVEQGCPFQKLPGLILDPETPEGAPAPADSQAGPVPSFTLMSSKSWARRPLGWGDGHCFLKSQQGRWHRRQASGPREPSGLAPERLREDKRGRLDGGRGPGAAVMSICLCLGASACRLLGSPLPTYHS